VAGKLIKTKGRMHNPDCDGSHCISSHGEVRVLPYSDDGNLILCYSCFQYEISWRKEENRRTNRNFKIPGWETLSIYPEIPEGLVVRTV